jgi:predicted nucleic acid-binding protein
VDGAVLLVRLGPEHMSRLIEVSSQFNLDFDDAYQYVAAELRGLVIVSFDGDFDRTLLGRKTPAQVLGMNA